MSTAVIARVVRDGVCLVDSLHQPWERAVRRLEKEVVMRRHEAVRDACARFMCKCVSQAGLKACEVVLVPEELFVRQRTCGDVVEASGRRARLARHAGTIAVERPLRKMAVADGTAVPGTAVRCLAPLETRPRTRRCCGP